MNNYKKYFLSAFLFLCLAFTVISIYVVKNNLYYLLTFKNPLNFDIRHDRLDICVNDSDCMLADYEGCCSNKKPINKKYLNQYNRMPLWQKELDGCGEINCPWFIDSNELKCRFVDGGEKRCTSYIDVAASTDLEKCVEKYDFISREEECSVDCESKKAIYAIYVGGGGRFEETMNKTNYNMNGYDEIFPKEIEKKVMAVYDVSRCDPCEKKFLIREGQGLNEVDIYRFCYFLEQQNIICKDCGRVDKISKE